MKTKKDILEYIKITENTINKNNKYLERLKQQLLEIESKPKWSLSYHWLLFNVLDNNKNFLSNGNFYTNKKHYNKLEALRKLQLLREEIVGDWEPDLKNHMTFYIIECIKNKVIIEKTTCYFKEFSFKTTEQRDWFYDKHIELLKVYYGITHIPNS